MPIDEHDYFERCDDLATRYPDRADQMQRMKEEFVSSRRSLLEVMDRDMRRSDIRSLWVLAACVAACFAVAAWMFSYADEWHALLGALNIASGIQALHTACNIWGDMPAKPRRLSPVACPLSPATRQDAGGPTDHNWFDKHPALGLGLAFAAVLAFMLITFTHYAPQVHRANPGRLRDNRADLERGAAASTPRESEPPMK